MFEQMVSRGRRLRTHIAATCGAAVSALNLNPRIKSAPITEEALLREAGVLPAMAIPAKANDEAAGGGDEENSARRYLIVVKLTLGVRRHWELPILHERDK